MTDLRLVTTSEAPRTLLGAARALCDRAFADFGDDDWQHALGGWHAMAVDGGEVVAHAAVVPRELQVGDRTFGAGYVEAVAAEPTRQGQGLGTLVMREIEDVVRRRHDLGALSTGAHGFYRRLGWERWLGPTYVRRGVVAERTEDEDDGVMVLRHGPSATVELTAAITCGERTGDDW